MTRQDWSKRPGRSSKWITRTRRLALYIRDGFTCQYCGRDLRGAAPHEVTLDHLRPQELGGGHQSRNLVTACRACNCARKLTPWRQYAPAGAVARILRTIRRVPNLALARDLRRADSSTAHK